MFFCTCAWSTVGFECGETDGRAQNTEHRAHKSTHTHSHARAHGTQESQSSRHRPAVAVLLRSVEIRTSTAHHSAVRLCGASGSPPASNPYCPSIFLLAVAIFEPISSRSPPPSALLPAPSSHRPSSTVHGPSSIVHRPQPRPQALILHPPAWRRTDPIPCSACAQGQGHGSSLLPTRLCCLLWAVGTYQQQAVALTSNQAGPAGPSGSRRSSSTPRIAATWSREPGLLLSDLLPS